MNKVLLLSCFLILFSLACVGPTGFLMDESKDSTLIIQYLYEQSQEMY